MALKFLFAATLKSAHILRPKTLVFYFHLFPPGLFCSSSPLCVNVTFRSHIIISSCCSNFSSYRPTCLYVCLSFSISLSISLTLCISHSVYLSLCVSLFIYLSLSRCCSTCLSLFFYLSFYSLTTFISVVIYL